jgi:O-succinylhomoserine sulfhydrylase
MDDKTPPRRRRPATELVHGGSLRSQFGEMSEAIFLTQGFSYADAEAAEARFKGQDPGFVYSRFSNPTVFMFEERMRLLEGAAAARATASGMAAVTASLLCMLKAGDHVVAAKALFSSCLYVIEDLLPRFGVASTLVDGTDLDQWRDAVRPNTKAFFLESPTNPTLEVVDIAEVAKIAHEAGALLIVDNVFATPIWQRPIALGADVVVYSATKHLDGQGRVLGGIILAADPAYVTDHLHTFLRQTGPSLSPFNAWVLLKGLETLAIRVERQTATAARLADAIARHPKVSRLIYPGRPDHPQAAIVAKQMTGGSTLIALEVEGGKEAAFRVAGALEIVKISNNLGDAKSLVTHPSTTTHQRLSEAVRLGFGITPGMLRLSVGLEDADDLIEDVTAALDKA